MEANEYIERMKLIQAVSTTGSGFAGVTSEAAEPIYGYGDVGDLADLYLKSETLTRFLSFELLEALGDQQLVNALLHSIRERESNAYRQQACARDEAAEAEASEVAHGY